MTSAPRTATTAPGRGDDGYVPVIDMGFGPDTPGRDPAGVAAEIDSALSTSGFLVAVGHGVPRATVEGLLAAVRGFFADGPAATAPVAMDPEDPLRRGWTVITPGVHEQFTANRMGEIGDRARELAPEVPGLAGPNRWPSRPGFRDAYLAYDEALAEFGVRLTGLMARALGLPTTWFAERFGDHMTPLTTNFYPGRTRAPEPGTLRNAEHRDWGAITILHQDDGPAGLQVHSDGGWVDVAPVPDSFVVNVGRLMALWTDGRWPSTLHRVVHAADADAHRDRFSVGFFHHPDPDAEITCVPTLRDPAREHAYPTVRSGAYFTDRAVRARAQAEAAGVRS